MFGESDIEKEPQHEESYDPKPTPSTNDERQAAEESKVVKDTQNETSNLKKDIKGE